MIIGRRKDTEKERERLNKERRKRNRKYGQAELKHSKRGITSCLMAGCSLFLSVLVISVSYINRGDINLMIGIAGILALVLAWVGMFRAVQGFKEREKNYASCKIGLGCNIIFLLGLFAIFLRGLL